MTTTDERIQRASFLTKLGRRPEIGAFVALLMIAGEFDLSAGVMIGTSGLFMGLLITEWGFGIWPSIAITMVAAMAVGAMNGWLVVTTGLPHLS